MLGERSTGSGLAWLRGAGAVAVPGIGLLIGVGPIMAALVGVAVVRTAHRGLAAALVILGVPEHQAKQYEVEIRKGKILVGLRADDGEDAERATEIFTRAGAQDVFDTRQGYNERELTARSA